MRVPSLTIPWIFLLAQSYCNLSFAADQSKFKVCTITVNSSDEMNQFKKHLNDDQFEFKELLDSSNQQWLEKACNPEETPCDVLVISGHFGGNTFSSEAGFNGKLFKISDLEQKACENKCDNLLRSPKEVFMFGCNTLASKAPDKRSKTDYYKVLVNHGYGEVWSQMTAEERYGPLGEPSIERLGRLFSGAGHLYGFFSTAPLGKDIAPALDAYFKKRGDYAEWLKKVEVEPLTHLNQINEELAQALKSFHFSECSHFLDSDAGSEAARELCMLRSSSVGRKNQLEILDRMASNSDIVKYMPDLAEIFWFDDLDYGTPEELEVIARIKNETVGKQLLLNQLAETTLPLAKMQIAEFAKKFGWVSDDELQKLKKMTHDAQ